MRERIQYRRQNSQTVEKQHSRSWEAGLIDVNDAESTDKIVQVHDCGLLHVECQHCKAKFFASERLASSSARNPKFGLCCGDGKVKCWKHAAHPTHPNDTNRCRFTIYTAPKTISSAASLCDVHQQVTRANIRQSRDTAGRTSVHTRPAVCRCVAVWTATTRPLLRQQLPSHCKRRVQ